jgi:hypothetical protein
MAAAILASKDGDGQSRWPAAVKELLQRVSKRLGLDS